MKPTEDQLQQIEQLAAQLTPPSQIAVLLSINEDQLRLAISRHGSDTRQAFMRGLAATATKIRQNNIALADAGSPDAIRSCFQAMREMIDDLNE